MMLYLKIEITRVYGKVPSGKPSRFFASLASDAIASGRFDETRTEYYAINCCDMRDADQEYEMRRLQLKEAFHDSNVVWSIRRLTKHEHDTAMALQDKFEECYA
jgi:hypothetical protein